MRKKEAIVYSRKDKYVTGYIGNGECLYGKGSYSDTLNNIQPMTLQRARKELKKFPASDVAIFKIVPIYIRRFEI